jgi:hypothetical protein
MYKMMPARGKLRADKSKFTQRIILLKCRSMVLSCMRVCRSHSKQYIQRAKEQEATNPMTLAEMIRYMIHFMHEVLCEDPLPNLPLQIPCLKGEYAEGLVT